MRSAGEVVGRCVTEMTVRPCASGCKRAVDRRFRQSVQGGGWLVEDENRGLADERASQSHPWRCPPESPPPPSPVSVS